MRRLENDVERDGWGREGVRKGNERRASCERERERKRG